MAFQRENFVLGRGIYHGSISELGMPRASFTSDGLAPLAHYYGSSVDSNATIAGSGYFNDLLSMEVQPDNFDNPLIRIGDIIHIYATDGIGQLEVTAISPSITTSASPYVLGANSVATADIQDGAVTTAKIADANVTTAKITDANVTTAKIADANVTTAKITDANVTLAKLASAVSSKIPVYVAQAMDGGGSATITISSLTGVTATSVALAQVAASTNAVSVNKVTAGTDQIVVLLSGDPGAATVINYVVYA